MVATLEPVKITAAELNEANQQYDAVGAELEVAKARHADAVSEVVKNWSSPFATRHEHETAATVKHLTARANALAQFIESAHVDDDPEPDPPAPAARPVGIIQRDSRVIVARLHGCCRCCQRGIVPGQRIVRTFCAGTWAHETCWERDIAARKAAGERHRDRALGACFLAFFDRLPAAA